MILDGGRSALLGADLERRSLHPLRRLPERVSRVPQAAAAAYGPVYSGPMGAVLMPLLEGLANAPDLPHATSLCGPCADACP